VHVRAVQGAALAVFGSGHWKAKSRNPKRPS